MEARTLTRFDVHYFARQAYKLGIHYIGGCCGFQPYHIRAIAEELSAERGELLPAASAKHLPWGMSLANSTNSSVAKRYVRKTCGPYVKIFL